MNPLTAVRSRDWRTPVAITILVLAGLVGLTLGPGQQRIVVTMMINVVVAYGLQIFMGYSGTISLGTPAFVAVAAYTFGVLAAPINLKLAQIPNAPFGLADLSMSLPMAAVLAVGVAGLVAAITGVVVAKSGDLAASIITLAVLIVVHTVIVNWLDLTRGPRALYGIPIHTNIGVATASAVLAALASYLMRRSRLGLQLRSYREDPLASQASAVNPFKVKLVAWILGALVASVAGILTASFVGTIHPSLFYFELAFMSIAILLLGGRSSIIGVVLGVIIITTGTELMRLLERGPTIGSIDLPQIFGLPPLFLGLVIYLVMRFRPEGLVADG